MIKNNYILYIYKLVSYLFFFVSKAWVLNSNFHLVLFLVNLKNVLYLKVLFKYII